ncbi:conserved hypothetical protein [Sporisorium reilianum SRZ2]|uniref:Uncharacterized protein n=1 Tax=Sporisorium reilianum (strain SRZ2) TaxID=999809 RepID=E6ZQ23_SPORE|nr:conserved hypothetical protein [Sporisorium reilianum SRZ2]
MRGGVDKQRTREASSDASLWDDIDDTNSTFADIVTPPLQQDLPLPQPPTTTASHPITITDSTPESSTRHQALDLELFPSGQPPSSFDFDAAAANEPWSQASAKATQYLRDEWLISVGQKQPDDLVQDLLAPPSRPTAKGGEMASSLTSKSKRGRSSLLDQLDVICSSPSQHFSSSPNANENESSKPSKLKSPAATERQPLQPVTSIVSNGKAPSTHDETHELSAIDMLEMSCSPPSQTFPHMTLIKDMPQELQDIYHRLAFGPSSTSSDTTSPNPGTTVRGTRGKTWQTTWQDDADQANQSTPGSSRGRKPASATAATAARKGARATNTKTRSSFASGTSSSRNRSQYFASLRGRARGRGRGRGRAR